MTFIALQSQGQDFKNDPTIISPSSEVIKIRDGFRVLEGSSVSPNGEIYFVELIHSLIDPFEAGKIWKYNPTTNEFEIFVSPSSLTVGTEFDANGDLICAEFSDRGGRRITKRNIKTRDASFLALGYQDKPFNGPNDLTISEKDRFTLLTILIRSVLKVCTTDMEQSTELIL